jgi:hypothetical protein
VPLLVRFNGMAKQGALKTFYAGVSHQQSVAPIIFWTSELCHLSHGIVLRELTASHSLDEFL